jgi:hypothetical protein
MPILCAHVPDPSWIGLFPAGRLVRMIPPAISRYPVPKLEDLPEDIRVRILDVQEKAGFIPNVFLTLARRPDEFRALLICCNECL